MKLRFLNCRLLRFSICRKLRIFIGKKLRFCYLLKAQTFCLLKDFWLVGHSDFKSQKLNFVTAESSIFYRKLIFSTWRNLRFFDFSKAQIFDLLKCFMFYFSKAWIFRGGSSLFYSPKCIVIIGQQMYIGFTKWKTLLFSIKFNVINQWNLQP